jgi:hypothetical protein
MGAHLLYTGAKKRKDGNPQSFQECDALEKGGSRMERRQTIRKNRETFPRLSFRNMRMFVPQMCRIVKSTLERRINRAGITERRRARKKKPKILRVYTKNKSFPAGCVVRLLRNMSVDCEFLSFITSRLATISRFHRAITSLASGSASAHLRRNIVCLLEVGRNPPAKPEDE